MGVFSFSPALDQLSLTVLSSFLLPMLFLSFLPIARLAPLRSNRIELGLNDALVFNCPLSVRVLPLAPLLQTASRVRVPIF